MERKTKSYRKRLQEDRDKCFELGMTDMVELFDEKIEEYKAYQRKYYHKNKKVENE